MKKKVSVLAVVLLVVVLAGANVWAETVVIGEYPVNGFALRGEIKSQVENLALKISAEYEKETKAELVISVIGYADRTGPEAKNDKIAAQRAEQVAQYFRSLFPRASISNWSEGTEGESRAVAVEYSFYSPPEPLVVAAPLVEAEETAEEKGKTFPFLEIFISWAIFIIFLLLFASRFFGNAKKRRELIEQDALKYIEEHREKKEAEKGPIFIAFEFLGNNYVFLPEVDEEGKYLALKEVPGKNGEVYRYSEVKSLKGSLKSSFKQDPSLLDNLRLAGRLFREGDPGFEKF